MGKRIGFDTNTFILSKMEKEGISSIIELARRSGVGQPTLDGLISARIFPKTKKGEWRKEVRSLATFFECLPGTLFVIKKKSRARGTSCTCAEIVFTRMRDSVRSVHIDEIFHPEHALYRSELARHQEEILACLTPQEKRAIRLCFGFDGKGERTLAEAGKELNISHTRVGQLRSNAFEKLQRKSKLKELYAGE